MRLNTTRSPTIYTTGIPAPHTVINSFGRDATHTAVVNPNNRGSATEAESPIMIPSTTSFRVDQSQTQQAKETEAINGQCGSRQTRWSIIPRWHQHHWMCVATTEQIVMVIFDELLLPPINIRPQRTHLSSRLRLLRMRRCRCHCCSYSSWV